MKRRAINVHLLTPVEAGRLLSEYKHFFAEGPPYGDTKNAHVLKQRDQVIINTLAGKAGRRVPND